MGDTDVDRQTNKIIISLFVLIIAQTGLFMDVENSKALLRINTDPEWTENRYIYREGFTNIEFNNSLYFVVVTIITVGYGDINPISTLGKIMTVGTLSITLVIIPQQTSELMRLIRMQSKYKRKEYKKSSDTEHVVVTGFIELQAIKNFCEELFHEDHDSSFTDAVLLQPQDPNADFEIFKQKTEKRMEYLSGDPLSGADLARAKTQSATACILLTNKNSRNT